MRAKEKFFCFMIILLSFQICTELILAQKSNPDENLIQAQISLTVSESKRLIAKAIVQMPIIKKSMKDGMIIIARGTTNTYVAEEILGKSIERGTFVTGRVYPQKGGKKIKASSRLSEIILINGKVDEQISYSEAVKKLKAGDVMIKGANALDYKNKAVGVYIGSSSAGATGKFLPYVVARKAYLVLPIGLEKLVAGDLIDISNMMRAPVESINKVPSMFLLTGEIVTEIEAIEILTGVSAIQIGAGGIGGAEGGVRLLLRGSRNQVENVLALVEEIYGEPPFVE